MRTLCKSFACFALIVLFQVGHLNARPQLGLQTWTCREMTFEEAVKFAAQQGITQLELYKKHIDPAADRQEHLRQKAFLDLYGVTAYSIGVSGTTLNKEDNRRLFETAEFFDMKVIVVEPRDLAIWDNLEELVKEYDIKLAIHNHGTGSIYGNPSVVKHVLAERDERIGVCMDIGWVTAAGFEAGAILRNYGDRVFDMHMKDKRVDPRDDSVEIRDTHIGLGNTDYLGVFEIIKETNWSGVMAIETDSKDFAHDPTEFVQRAKAYFEAYFGEE